MSVIVSQPAVLFASWRADNVELLQIRFHLDEHVAHAIAAGLRRYGVDVTVTSDVGLLHAPDDVHLAFTRDTTRVMVTHDEDFLVLHSQGIPHAGIAYCPPDTHPIGYIMQALLLIWGLWNPRR